MKRKFQSAVLLLLLPFAGCRACAEILVDRLLDPIFGEDREPEPGQPDYTPHWDRGIAPHRSN